MRRESDGDEVHDPDGNRDGNGYGNDSVDFRKDFRIDAYACTADTASDGARLVDALSYSDVRGTGSTPCALRLGSLNQISVLRVFKRRRGRLTEERAERQEVQLLLPKKHWAFAAWKASETTRSDRTRAERIVVGRRLRPQSYFEKQRRYELRQCELQVPST